MEGDYGGEAFFDRVGVDFTEGDDFAPVVVAPNVVRHRVLDEDAGVRVTNTGNVPRLDPADLRRALHGRDVS